MNPLALQKGQIPDGELIQRILTGEKHLFEQIIRRYNQRLYRMGMSILNDGMEVEDMMQSTYVKAYEHLSSFESRSSFITWLTRIMMNECLKQKNKGRRLTLAGDRPFERITNMKTPAQELINKELNAVLENAISGLPEKYRVVFILREVEDLSIKETAELLDLEVPNVKVRLNRAKTMLRENLQGYVKDKVYAFHLDRCDLMVNRVFSVLQIEPANGAQQRFLQ